MIHRIFTVFDEKAGAFLLPFFAPSRGLAIRSFTETVNQPDHVFNKHPADFTLFALGTYDDSSAMFDLAETPESLGLAIEFLTQEKN